MGNYFFTADTHFGHKRILTFQPKTRGHFKTIEEHDAQLINNWNAVVGKKDKVFHLGDFAFGNKNFCTKIRKQLNGQVALIFGNHDAGAWQIRKRFVWSDYTKSIRIRNQEIFLSHYSHLTWPKFHYGVWHLFGHSHGSLNTWIQDHLNDHKMTDVGVDCWNLTPVNFDLLKEIMDRKVFKPIDDHGKS